MNSLLTAPPGRPWGPPSGLVEMPLRGAILSPGLRRPQGAQWARWKKNDSGPGSHPLFSILPKKTPQI
jgi:hypothetical protein